MLTIQERVKSAKELVEAQFNYDMASFSYYKMVERIADPRKGVDVDRIGIDWHPEWLGSDRLMISSRILEGEAPVKLRRLEQAEVGLVEAYIAAKGVVVIERPKMKGPRRRSFYYAGDAIFYGRHSMIIRLPDADPYPAFPLDPLNGVHLRERWEVCLTGMEVIDFLQSGGYLWELDNYIKAGLITLEGDQSGYLTCDRDDYPELQRRMGIK